MRKVIILATLVGVAGCAPTVLTATPNEYVISGVMKLMGGSGKYAAAHCAKYGKVASFVSRQSGQPDIYTFRCIAP